MADPDTTVGRTVLVTGPTRGLGREVVRALCRRDPALSLILMGRDCEQMAETRDEAASAVSLVHTVTCDFASLASIRAAGGHARRLVAGASLAPLQAVVANAGVQTVGRQHQTADGFELTFGVNVLANYLLFQVLLPAMARGAHVVLVGSGTHRSDRRKGLVELPRWDEPRRLARPGSAVSPGDRRAGQRAYSTSKLAVNYLCHEIARRHADSVTCNVYDPGLMPGTGLARHMPAWRRYVWEKVMPRLNLPGSSTPERSAACIADLALGRVFTGLNGGYVHIDEITSASGESFDRARESILWKTCGELTGT
jgi:NAD(P)-dependent dehydrogenase (short-subunit alcohol dehydrogenase family)